MIARTVNNLVPKKQLKLDIFKKYVSEATISEATISEATISEATLSEVFDIDALPKYA
jgi:hypothetical protein